jgi:hypothetical protein
LQAKDTLQSYRLTCSTQLTHILSLNFKVKIKSFILSYQQLDFNLPSLIFFNTRFSSIYKTILTIIKYIFTYGLCI